GRPRAASRPAHAQRVGFRPGRPARHFIERHLPRSTSALGVLTSAGVIDQQEPHGPGSDRKEVSAVLPFDVLLLDQAEIGFVDERGGLQRVTGTLPLEVALSQPAQFVIDQRDELVKGRPISLAPIAEQLSYFLWRGRHVVPPVMVAMNRKWA